jgi:hypothetical protein
MWDFKGALRLDRYAGGLTGGVCAEIACSPRSGGLNLARRFNAG